MEKTKPKQTTAKAWGGMGIGGALAVLVNEGLVRWSGEPLGEYALIALSVVLTGVTAYFIPNKVKGTS